MQEQWQDSWLSSSANDSWLESLYETWLNNPADVLPEWQTFFEKNASSSDILHEKAREYFIEAAKHPIKIATNSGDIQHLRQQEKLVDLITAYRSFGHLQADIDPLGLFQHPYHPALELAWHGFSTADLQTTFDATLFPGVKKSTATLNEIVTALRDIYCGKIGIEYMHIANQAEVEWIQQRMEQEWRGYVPTHEERLRILDHLVMADGLEKYIGAKYVGQKRFSLEGGDSLIPLLDTIIRRGTENGAKEIVIGMAHRGRLNVLVNVLGKEPTEIFAGFEGKHTATNYSGDVKYHMGFSSDLKTPYGPVHLTLAFNPSHLEIVSPVVQGSVRSRQRRRKDTEHRLVVPIQIHGDAAFAGQGVVSETFSLSQTRWFLVGGSIHIVINNQVGFTTSNPKDARSSLYCTDIAKMVDAPVIHVNADSPEAVFFAAKLAMDYRNRFRKDIVIDLVCYRRHGHNEADEPSATQPMMYKVIRSLPVLYTVYAARLVAENIIPQGAADTLIKQYRDRLDAGKCVVDDKINNDTNYEFSASWDKFLGTEWTTPAKTSVPKKRLKELGEKLEQLPDGFVLQMQVQKTMDAREKMTQGEMPLNWGYCEIMAYATLLTENYPIRLCGQDACRGTFAHRHAVLHDQNTGQHYIPLGHISSDQAQINLIDSLLSEEAVLAFEYGYASAEPNFLTIWEAQFGDFANGAQVVIDQFISSGEQKWNRLCGLVMFLPHGYEGQGPEHSSARLERYLQLCAQNNMQVCVPSTPAQIFHLLRRQMIRPWRKPLIVMTPKSLLRHPKAVSSLDDLSEGQFELVLDDAAKPKNIERVILCCGKVYYELLEKREKEKLDNVALIRIEQLYPFPEEAIKKVLSHYKHVKKFIWCQEEPQNQGAWFVIQQWLPVCLASGQTLTYAGRSASASPAAGYLPVHLAEQAALVIDALGLKSKE